jgi:hypothetical protein
MNAKKPAQEHPTQMACIEQKEASAYGRPCILESSYLIVLLGEYV